MSLTASKQRFRVVIRQLQGCRTILDEHAVNQNIRIKKQIIIRICLILSFSSLSLVNFMELPYLSSCERLHNQTRIQRGGDKGLGSFKRYTEQWDGKQVLVRSGKSKGIS